MYPMSIDDASPPPVIRNYCLSALSAGQRASHHNGVHATQRWTPDL